MIQTKYKITPIYEILSHASDDNYIDTEILCPIFYLGQRTHYFISSFGILYSQYSSKLRKIVPRIDDGGYVIYSLRIDGKRINISAHRLVAMAFIPNPENKNEVNHKNGNKSQNYIWNLEWSTHSENMTHAYKHGLNHKGSDNTQSIHNDSQIIQVCKLLEENKLDMGKISNITGVSIYTINGIIKGKKWKHISSNYNIHNYNVKCINTGSTPKYSEDDIRKVCKLLSMNKYNMREISSMTGVSLYIVQDIKRRRTWKHISQEYNF